jgi:hypothetical protein
MKQKDILKLKELIRIVNGKGSQRLKWAVYRTGEKLEKEATAALKFMDEMKPDRLLYLQKLQDSYLQNNKDKEAFNNFKHREELDGLLFDFVNSKEYQNFLNTDNEEFKPYPITYRKSDLEGVELNSQVFWLLDRIGEGLEAVMEEIINEEEPEAPGL